MDALELEEKIRDLIVSERTSVEFQGDVRALLLERDEFQNSAADAVAAARASPAARHEPPGQHCPPRRRDAE